MKLNLLTNFQGILDFKKGNIQFKAAGEGISDISRDFVYKIVVDLNDPNITMTEDGTKGYVLLSRIKDQYEDVF
jgi:hypothetical protein